MAKGINVAWICCFLAEVLVTCHLIYTYVFTLFDRPVVSAPRFWLTSRLPRISSSSSADVVYSALPIPKHLSVWRSSAQLSCSDPDVAEWMGAGIPLCN